MCVHVRARACVCVCVHACVCVSVYCMARSHEGIFRRIKASTDRIERVERARAA